MFRMKTLVGIIIILAVFCCPTAMAYQLANVYVQLRAHEDGHQWNKLNFEILDDAGDFIPGTDVVTSVHLYDPVGTAVNLSQLGLDPDLDFLYGSYDAYNSRWTYDDWSMVKDYSAEILDSLITGTYRLVVTTDDAQSHESFYTFNGTVTFPKISASSFQIQPDAVGNLIWCWDIPKELFTLSPSQSTRISPYISIYQGEEYKGLLWATIPSHLGCLFIPQDRLQEIISRGNEFKFGVQIRTNDNNNRYVSNLLNVSSLPTTIVKSKKVVVVPMF
jgi:hypothetical protein